MFGGLIVNEPNEVRWEEQQTDTVNVVSGLV